MRHNHFVFQVMTDFDRDEIVFSSKDILYFNYTNNNSYLRDSFN